MEYPENRVRRATTVSYTHLSADVRVEITDGNVAIFNEVDVIKNIIVDF